MIQEPQAPQASPESPAPQAQDTGEETLGELLRRIDNARATMSVNNSNRLLLLQCRAALLHLSKRVIVAERLASQAAGK